LEQTCTVGGDLNAGRLVPVLTDYALPEAAIRAVYPHNRHLSAKVRAFVDFLVARFGQDPDWDEWHRAAPPHPRFDDKNRHGRRRVLPASLRGTAGSGAGASLGNVRQLERLTAQSG
jgi:hypothetical protein